MKKLIIICSVAFMFASCGGSNDNNNETTSTTDTEATTTDATTETASTEENPSYDPERGEGKFHDMDLPEKIDPQMAAEGQKIAELKCQSCHKMTSERLVGPGWKGVTERHKPEWIMNFMTNTDEMIDKDPKAQAMLEICMVRMPNQNLSDQEARDILEFMRKNDGVK
jgi:cytochrome c2